MKKNNEGLKSGWLAPSLGVILAISFIGAILVFFVVAMVDIVGEKGRPHVNCVTLNFSATDDGPQSYTKSVHTKGDKENSLLASKKGVVSLMQEETPLSFTVDDVKSYDIENGYCSG